MSKYQVRIVMEVRKDCEPEPMSSTTQVYSNLEYFELLGIEKAVVGSLMTLGDSQLAAMKK